MKKWVNGEILLIMLKKMTAVLCIFASLFFFSSCKMPERQDWSQLIYMTDRYCKNMKIEIRDSFFYEGQWFLILKSPDGQKIIITAREDESLLINSVSVSVLNAYEEEEDKNDGASDTVFSENSFIMLSEGITKAFCGKEKAFLLLDGVGFYKENALFSDETFFFTEGRYSLTFFNSEIGSSLMIEMIY